MEQTDQSSYTHQSEQNVQSENIIQQQSGSEQMIKEIVSEEDKKRCNDILEEFNKKQQEFQENAENRFTVVNPNMIILANIIQHWMQRKKRTDKFLMTLELKEVDEEHLNQKNIKKLFQSVGSIKLIVNQRVIQLEGILLEYGQYIYEGIEKFMIILSDSNKSQYIGQTIKISENEYRYHGMGTLISRNFKDGFEYTGQFDNGKRHGQGQLSTKLTIYEGQFKNDYKHGRGKQTVLKKKKKNVPKPVVVPQYIYFGEFKQGNRHGDGQQIKIGSYKFTGEWKHNQKNGKGSIQYKNGDTYEGEWQNNLFNGQGTYIQKGNCTYVGDFKDGKYHGKGVMEYQNGDRYEGGFEGGKKQGQGKYDWKIKGDDEDYYDGQWKNDSAEGQGVSMIGGQFYNGEFKNGKRHGEGQWNTLEGDLIRAIWQEGKIIKQIEINGQLVENDGQI